MVPSLEEATEVLAAPLLTIAFAERFPQRVAVPHQWEVAERHDATDPVADGVAQVEVQDAVKAVVLIEWADAGEISSSEGQQIVLQGIDVARLTWRGLIVQLTEMAHIRGQQSVRADCTYGRVCQDLEQWAGSVAGPLHGGIQEGDGRTAAGGEARDT